MYKLMSRIGKVPVSIPEGVKVEISGLSIKVEGPKGAIEKTFSGQISIEKAENTVVIKPLEPAAKAMWGTARSIISGMMIGAHSGFTEQLEVNRHMVLTVTSLY